MERYGIDEEDAVGKVLWHSLNESGEIGVYDMKFGNTIIRNLTESDLVDKVIKEAHGVTGNRDDKPHGVQHDSDPKRGKKK